jgi:hypothetical protein
MSFTYEIMVIIDGNFDTCIKLASHHFTSLPFETYVSLWILKSWSTWRALSEALTLPGKEGGTLVGEDKGEFLLQFERTKDTLMCGEEGYKDWWGRDGLKAKGIEQKSRPRREPRRLVEEGSSEVTWLPQAVSFSSMQLKSIYGGT